MRLIAQMLDAAHAVLNEMRISNHCELIDAPTRTQMQCTALNKLRLERYLTAHKMMPAVQNASEILLSPLEVLQKLLEATIVDVDISSSNSNPVSHHEFIGFLQYDRLHEDCTVGLKLKAKLDHIMETRLLGAEREMMDKIREHAGEYIQITHGRSLWY